MRVAVTKSGAPCQGRGERATVRRRGPRLPEAGLRAAATPVARRALGGALLAAGCAACSGAAETPLTFAADSASNPTVAHRDGRSYVAWVGTEAGHGAVFLARVGDPDAVRVNDIPGDAAPHLQAPAQVAVGPEGNVYVLWQNNTPIEGRRFPASDLRMAVSRDGGRTFSPAITVNDDAGGEPSSHTFHDLVVGADGTVYASWIDSRERDAASAPGPQASKAAHHGHHGGEGAAAGTLGPQIRIAKSTDGGRSFGPSAIVDRDACPCCRTSLTQGADGSLYVAWRKIFPGGVRDIVVARAEPGTLEFGEPVRVHEDGWVFPGCPHAGPSLAMDDSGRLLVGWYTGREGRQGLWYAISSDRGVTFGEPSEVLTADWVPPSQLRLATSQGRVWAAWDDRTGEAPLVRVATGAIGERLTPRWSVAGGDPAVAAAGEGAVVTWLEGTAARGRVLGN